MNCKVRKILFNMCYCFLMANLEPTAAYYRCTKKYYYWFKCWCDFDRGFNTNGFYSYQLQERVNSYIHYFGKLFHQYIVDQYAKIQYTRLKFVRFNQEKIRAELYCGLMDAVNERDCVQGNSVGCLIVLPSTFLVGDRHMHQLDQDAMSVVRVFGKPDIFITFTCNYTLYMHSD